MVLVEICQAVVEENRGVEVFVYFETNCASAGWGVPFPFGDGTVVFGGFGEIGGGFFLAECVVEDNLADLEEAGVV